MAYLLTGDRASKGGRWDAGKKLSCQSDELCGKGREKGGTSCIVNKIIGLHMVLL